MAFSIQSITTTIEEPEDCENQAASCVLSSSISPEVLNSIPNTIRDMLWHEKRYTSIPARKLLHAYIASLLNISNKYAGCLESQTSCIIFNLLQLTWCMTSNISSLPKDSMRGETSTMAKRDIMVGSWGVHKARD